MKQTKNLIVIMIAMFALFSVMSCVILRKPISYSETERRPLAQFPVFSLKEFISGRFAKNFESFALDQFPLRDEFRSVKAYTHFYGLGQKDNNGLYLYEDYIVKMEYPLHADSVNRATDVFGQIHDLYLKDKNISVYASVIPDKNYFLAEKSGHLCIDYNQLTQIYRENMPYAKYIDIFPYLTIEDYYRTDTHWRQECILDVAQVIAEQMDVSLQMTYEKHQMKQPFYGVYYGQLGIPTEPDHFISLWNKEMNAYKVTDCENNKEIEVFVSEKLNGMDMYEAFLGGPLSLVVIENKKATTDKELIVFRDSYASAIAPLLAEGFKKITLIDIRYINSRFLKDIVSFEDGQNVLFLYSSMVLNNSETLK